MSRKPKRTRITAPREAAVKITIREVTRTKSGSTWTTFLVQGWQEGGRWMRRQFKDRGEAESFAAIKRVQMENQGAAQQMILSRLTQEQHDEAVAAFGQLGNTYALADVVGFFLKHHRPPEFTIRLDDAMKHFLDDKERDGLRPRTIQGLRWTVELFSAATDNPFIHEVSKAQVESFLRGLRAKDGIEKARRRSWEIHRRALHQFFKWCATPDTATNRPFTFSNPVDGIRKFSARQVREEQASKPATTSINDLHRIFTVAMRWRGGVLVRPLAFLYFAGIRPNELNRMTKREAELVNLSTRTITIPANVSKTHHERQVIISENLAAWLKAFPGDIIPKNFEALNKKLRKHFGLTHDEARHSFISYHVAAYRSVGDAALQAGNSEEIVKKHYLNTHTREEGETFWRITPDIKRRRAVLAKEPEADATPHLRAI